MVYYYTRKWSSIQMKNYVSEAGEISWNKWMLNNWMKFINIIYNRCPDSLSFLYPYSMDWKSTMDIANSNVYQTFKGMSVFQRYVSFSRNFTTNSGRTLSFFNCEFWKTIKWHHSSMGWTWFTFFRSEYWNDTASLYLSCYYISNMGFVIKIKTWIGNMSSWIYTSDMLMCFFR